MSTEEPHEVQEKEMPSPVCGEEQPQAPGQAGGQVPGKQVCSEGPRDPEAPLEPAKVNLAAKMATAFHASLGRALQMGLRKVFPLHSALVTPLWVCWVQCKRGTDTPEQQQQRGTTLLKCLEHLSCEKRLRELGRFSLETRTLQRDFTNV